MHADFISKGAQREILEMALLPLKDIVIFPHMIIPVFINEELCLNAVEYAVSHNRKIFLSAFKVKNKEGFGLESSLEAPFDVYDIGTICTVMRTRKLPDGRMKVLVQGVAKARINRLIDAKKFPMVELNELKDTGVSGSVNSGTEAVVRAVRESLEKVANFGKFLSPDILMILEDVREPGRLGDLVAANLGLKVEDAQQILSIISAKERLEKVHAFLSREIEVCQMQARIQNQAKEEIGKLQREHYLREQIRVLKNELGDTDSKDELEELWEKINSKSLSHQAKEEASRQMRRLEKMHQDTSEASLVRVHLETILDLPWGEKTEDKFDLKKVAKELDEDHFGLGQVKDRIIEYLAVKKLNPKAKSPILCFVGPPGVGKTSLGKSIAESIGRKFERISLGGVRDEADIRGHRKTYVGAFPGRVMSAIKNSKSMNPIIMLDEVDKLGQDYRGDPAAALLEVLDPEQNNQFVDHYIGISFDLSNVMFIANANTLDTIHPALKDRLEVIEITGYSEDEKLEIATRFLVPKQEIENGLSRQTIDLNKASLSFLIRGYTRESGLRNLEKKISAVCRKVARSIAEGVEVSIPVRITAPKIQKFLGSRVYGYEFSQEGGSVGVAYGMAYTPYGGEVLSIETSFLSGKGGFVLTGQLGDVMKESAQAGISYVKSRSLFFGIDPSFFEHHDIHIHIPQGAVSKDGPSAGVAIVSSILSSILGKPTLAKSSLTGEITLHGKILPVGGLREKILAAQREGIQNIFVPSQNRAIIEEFPSGIIKKLKVIYVSDYLEIFPILFSQDLIYPFSNKKFESTAKVKEWVG
jgi:ATP-dependent Lon protease